MLIESAIIMIPILFPILMGVLLLLGPKWEQRKSLCIYTGISLAVTAVLVAVALSTTDRDMAFILFHLTRSLTIYFKVDRIGRLFVVLVTVIWLITAPFAFSYMRHEQREQRFYGFYLITYGVLIGLDFAGNLITFYLFYELMTLVSMPMVLHSQTREAIMAALKYLLYSFCGAYMALFGLYFLFRYTNTLTFTAGGVLDMELVSGKEPFLLAVAFIMLLGFGVKAGMFPLHGWLSMAHPVAPAPASAVLSGIIVKAGVLGAIRVVYYIFGPDFLRGTWVQEAWLALIMITILLGSMMAWREKIWKKRLAYSTVSQVSYILLGLAMLQQNALQGALYHTVFHACIKCGLFLTAGAMIYQTGKTKVEDYEGLGKKMPVTMWCYTALSLALIGIPPASGFLSKWYLAMGALNRGGFLGVAGVVVLLISALLTAGYLLPVSIRAFLPGKNWNVRGIEQDDHEQNGHGQNDHGQNDHGQNGHSQKESEIQKEQAGLAGAIRWGLRNECDLLMLVPILILAVLAVGLGIFPVGISGYVREIAQLLIP